MGQPDVDVKEIATILLKPGGKVTARQLIESGLHINMVNSTLEVLKPTISDLTGWKELREYRFAVNGYDWTLDDVKKGKAANERWDFYLCLNELEKTMAIQLYDGEKKSMPAPDYQLYLLRDGRILVFNQGFHSSGRGQRGNGGFLGSAEEVLRHINSGLGMGTSLESTAFVIMMKALSKALDDSIKKRQEILAKQREIQVDVEGLISRVVAR